MYLTTFQKLFHMSCFSCFKGSIVSFAVAAVIVSSCATNPVTGKREFVMISEAQEISIGREANIEILQDMGVYEDTVLQEYVENIGYELADLSHRPNLPWKFSIVDSPAINAFALPGGYIYLTRGIMAYLGDEAELAGVLGHEIGHVTARHSVQAYTRVYGAELGVMLGQIFVPQMRTNPYGVPSLSDTLGAGLGLLFLKFSRDDEIQADRLGVEYALDGGWDPKGVAGMLSTLAKVNEVSDRNGAPNWLATHPEPADRVTEVRSTVDKLLKIVNPTSLRVERSNYLNRIQGLQFGDNPEDGIVRGNEFLHPNLRIALNFPKGWFIQNNDTTVLAKWPNQEFYMLLQLAEDRREVDLQEIAQMNMNDAGYRHRSGQRMQINGLAAYLGTYSGRDSEIGEIIALVAHIRHNRSLYAFGAIGPIGGMSQVEREVNQSIRSFRPLTRQEADLILPNEIALHTAQYGDTWEKIAKLGGEDIVEATTLAIINGYSVGEQPKPGDRLKIVVVGNAKP